MNREEELAGWTELKRAYQMAFNTPAGIAVMADMEYFWRANTTCVAVAPGRPVDVHLTFILEGRREVYIRIREYLDFTPEQLAQRYPQPAQGADGDEYP